MIPQDSFLLPHKSARWNEIKRNIMSAIESPLSILELISHLDYIEHLVHLGHPTSRLFDLLPLRMTFIGLGNFIDCLKPEQQNWLRDVLFPFIFRCAINIEQYNTDILSYCIRDQEYNVSIPFDLAASVVACSFMCLIPTHPSWNLLMNETNFTYFFASITDASCPQAQKLRSLLDYFEHCRNTTHSTLGLSSQALRITRRVLSIAPPPFFPLNSLGSLQPHMDGGKGELIRVLNSVPLPYLLVDAYRSVESVASRLRIPMTHFVNAYVGGNVLRSDGPTEDALFLRYPDLLTCLPLCHRLEDAEALWIDHFRGPFVPTDQFPSRYVPSDPEQLDWRRLVCMNTSCFPNWAAELQYSDACLISELTKACAAFFGVSQSTVMAASPAPPFSSSWWEYRLRNADKGENTRQHSRQSLRPRSANHQSVMTGRSRCLLNIAQAATDSILREATCRALELRAGLSSPLSRMSVVSRVLPETARSPPARGRSLSFQVLSGPIRLTTRQPTGSDPYAKRSSMDARISSRTSFSGSGGSGPATSYGQSSCRSSFSRGHSLSTQSSLRRSSDLSSNGSGCLLQGRLLDGGPSELREVQELEFEGLYSPRLSPLCLDSVTQPTCLQQSAISDATLRVEPDAGQLSSTGTKTRTSSRDRAECWTERASDVNRNYPPPGSGMVRLAEQIIDQAFTEAKVVAQFRSHFAHQFATCLSHRIVANSIKAATWFQSWSQRLICEASHKASQLRHTAEQRHSHTPAAASTVPRRVGRCARRGFRFRSGKKPHGSWTGLSQGTSSHWPSSRYPAPVSVGDNGDKSSSGSRLTHAIRHGCPRMCSHAISKRNHGRFGVHSGSIAGLSHGANHRHSDSTADDSASPSGDRSKGGYSAGWRFRLSPTHRATVDGLTRRPTTAVAFETPPTSSSSAHSTNLPQTPVRLHVTDQLNRYAGSVATECCARALQHVRMRQRTNASQIDPSRLRPAGLVTSSWAKHTINPAADPQIKVMTQWIAAATASVSSKAPMGVTIMSPPSSDTTPVTANSSDVSTKPSCVSTDPEPGSTIFTEYRISPLIVCTNNDPRLKELENIVQLIYAAGCTAGSLLSILMDYGAYRLAVNESAPDYVHPSTGSAPARPQTLFDFVRSRLSPSPVPVC